MAQVPGSCDLSTKDGQKPIVYWYQYSQQYVQTPSTSLKINKFYNMLYMKLKKKKKNNNNKTSMI